MSKLVRLDVTNKYTKLTVSFLVSSIEVIDEVLTFKQRGLTLRYHIENYRFTISKNELID